MQVDVTLLQQQLPDACFYPHAVAWHVQQQSALTHLGAVYGYAPQRGR